MSELRVAVLTCSDALASCTQEPSADVEDATGLAIIDACEARGWMIVAYHVCPKDGECVATSLNEMCDVEEADVVLTIGGTGLSACDVTPEVTELVSERLVPGIAEAIRQRAVGMDRAQMLSRATAGIRGSTLIINLPDDRITALDALEFVADLLEPASEQVHRSAPHFGPLEQ